MYCDWDPSAMKNVQQSAAAELHAVVVQKTKEDGSGAEDDDDARSIQASSARLSLVVPVEAGNEVDGPGTSHSTMNGSSESRIVGIMETTSRGGSPSS